MLHFSQDSTAGDGFFYVLTVNLFTDLLLTIFDDWKKVDQETLFSHACVIIIKRLQINYTRFLSQNNVTRT